VCTFLQDIQQSLKDLYAALKVQTHDQESLQVSFGEAIRFKFAQYHVVISCTQDGSEIKCSYIMIIPDITVLPF
jgi:hypothetical protein